MLQHVIRIAAMISVIILCALLPFLLGQYDTLAPSLSLIAQFFAVVGLALVPLGALWLVIGRWKPSANGEYHFVIATVVAVSIVWLALSLGALISSGISLAVVFLALWAYTIRRLLPGLAVLRRAPASAPSAVPWYLVIVPVAVALLNQVLAVPASEFARNRAIRNSAALIADIERYRTANGRYPQSLMSVHKDYKPSVVGIKDYLYEPRGDAYNLFFEQSTFHLGTQEFVMYNPRDRQALASHKLDVVQLSPEALALDRSRGHYAVHAAPQAHWKYFWFD